MGKGVTKSITSDFYSFGKSMFSESKLGESARA